MQIYDNWCQTFKYLCFVNTQLEGRPMYIAGLTATSKLKILMNEQGGFFACLVLHQMPMLCFPFMAAQVKQFIRRLKWEHVPPILTKTLSVVWQTHCPSKKTRSSLQEKPPCQTVFSSKFCCQNFCGVMSCGHFYVPGACVFIMAFLRCCVPSLQEAVTAEGLAVARSTYTVAFCCRLSWLALFREETSLWQERAHFVGSYQLLLVYISNA